MKTLALALAACLTASAATAATSAAPPAPSAAPTSAAPAGPKTYDLKLTDNDLQAIIFATQRIGALCETDDRACQAKLLLDDMGKRLGPQIQAQSAPPSPPTKK